MQFVHLSIRNFRSWRFLELPLSHAGIVCLQGDNGAGKSSIWDALFWCIYGTTPQSIRADEIRLEKRVTRVRLVLENDEGDHYRITRFRGHPTFKNKVIFDGKGIPKTDEDSLMADVQKHINAFVGVPSHVFLTTVLFAQRNFHYFHALTDQAKKEWIESITYGSLFPRCEALARSHVRDLEAKIARLEGKMEGLQTSMQTMEAHSAEERKKLEWCLRMSKGSLKNYRRDLRKWQKRHRVLAGADERERRAFEKMSAFAGILEEKRKIVDRAQQLESRCGLCGQQVSEAHRHSQVTAAQEAYHIAYKDYDAAKDIHVRAKAEGERFMRCQEALETVKRDISTLRENQQRYRDQLASLQRSTTIPRLVRKVRKQLRAVRRRLQYYQFWIQGFGFRGLRGMILQAALTYLEKRIAFYLRHLVADRIILDVAFANSRLVFLFNRRSYAALSGAEKQAVDLCTGLALRDLAESYNKCRFNILVLDEPVESFGERLTAAARDLLLSTAKPSTFLITHRPLSAKFDRVLMVSKNGSGLSRLETVYG